MKRAIGLIILPLIAGCVDSDKSVIKGPSPGIDYHNQNTAPWPWVSVVPSARALALQNVNFETLSHQLHYDMAFEAHRPTFQYVQVVLLDYAILPQMIKKGKHGVERPRRYFMVASFYTCNNRPPNSPDFEVTTTLRADKAGKEEAMRYMAREIIEELHALDDCNGLTPGKKVTINLD